MNASQLIQMLEAIKPPVNKDKELTTEEVVDHDKAKLSLAARVLDSGDHSKLSD